MIIWLILISFGILQGLFLILYLSINVQLDKAIRVIAIALVVTIVLISADYVLSNFYIIIDNGPFWGVGLSSPLWVLLAPLYFLLLIRFIKNTHLNFKNSWVHFLPFLFSLIINMPFLILPFEARHQYLSSYSLENEATVIHIISKLIYHLQLVLYPALIVMLLTKHKISNRNLVSIINYSFLIVGVTSFIHLISFNFLNLSFSWLTSNFIFLGLTLFIHSTVLLLLLKPDWILRQVDEVMSKYSISNLSNVDTSQLKNKLNLLISEQKVHLNEDLNLARLSEYLQTSPNKLSEFFNQVMGLSFNEYINQNRVEDAKQLLIGNEYELLTIEALAIKAGFKSTATFYRCFKKYTGHSPAQWRKSQVS